MYRENSPEIRRVKTRAGPRLQAHRRRSAQATTRHGRGPRPLYPTMSTALDLARSQIRTAQEGALCRFCSARFQDPERAAIYCAQARAHRALREPASERNALRACLDHHPRRRAPQRGRGPTANAQRTSRRRWRIPANDGTTPRHSRLSCPSTADAVAPGRRKISAIESLKFRDFRYSKNLHKFGWLRPGSTGFFPTQSGLQTRAALFLNSTYRFINSLVYSMALYTECALPASSARRSTRSRMNGFGERFSRSAARPAAA